MNNGRKTGKRKRNTRAAVVRRKHPRCPSCSSHHVFSTANAAWNAQRGRWEVVATFDEAWCNDCGRNFDIPDWDADHIPALAEQTPIVTDAEGG